MATVKNKITFGNIFEHSNARYFNSTQLANEFVWTHSFEKLISNKNHIILGSRGSGKTALIKMLSHECLSKLEHEKATDIINSRSFIATYIPLKVEWVNSIKEIEYDDHSFFKWCLNLSSCARFIDTVKSCLSTYILDEIERAYKEKEIAIELSKLWLTAIYYTLSDIMQELERIEYNKNIAFNKAKLGIALTDEDKLIGIKFNSELFKPFSMATSVIKKIIDIPSDATWCICIDEAEFLTKEHHRILNSYMRSYNDIIFKITTMPYRHYTLETTVGRPINIGHDFEYVYIDKLGFNDDNQSANQKFFESFAEKLFSKRIKGTYLDKDFVTLKKLLGESPLFDSNKEIDADLLGEHLDDATLERAISLKNTNPDLYQSSILRKVKGALILREAFRKYKGNASPSIYSGLSLAIRCSDGNPRRLLRLFNYLLSDKLQSQVLFDFISDKEQGRKIKDFSYSELDSLNLEVDGKETFELFNTVGKFFKDRLHTQKIGTRIVSSFDFDLTETEWRHIERAVDLGLIYPEFGASENDNKMPNRNGRFNFAYCLAPYFFLLPRKGAAIKLSTIINNKNFSQKRILSDYSQVEQIDFDFGDDCE